MTDNSLYSSDLPIVNIKRHSRQIVMMGTDAQNALINTRVLIIGMGGLGSPVLTYLSMAGISNIGIADFDVVELHNLQRQSIHTMDNIGKLKTDSAIEFVNRIGSSINITKHGMINEQNAHTIITDYDIIIDCCDQISIRYIVNDMCRRMNKWLINASVLKWEGQICIINPAGRCYRCMFPIMKRSAASCDSSGVIGAMCGVIGSMQANEVIKCIINKESIINNESKLILFNGLNNAYKQYYIKSRPCCICMDNNTVVDYTTDTCNNNSNSNSNSKGGSSKGGSNINSNSNSNNSNSNNTTFTNSNSNNNSRFIEWKDIIESINNNSISNNNTGSISNNIDNTSNNNSIDIINNTIVVDIRTPIHYKMFRFTNSININTDIINTISKMNTPNTRFIISCYKGVSSLKIVDELSNMGINAISAKGGIEGFKKYIDFDNL